MADILFDMLLLVAPLRLSAMSANGSLQSIFRTSVVNTVVSLVRPLVIFEDAGSQVVTAQPRRYRRDDHGYVQEQAILMDD